MPHDFELKGPEIKPYNPEDYGLPVWRDEDHPTPQQVMQATQATQAMQITQKKQESVTETKKALQLLWDNINWLYQKQLYKRPEVKELLDRYNIK